MKMSSWRAALFLTFLTLFLWSCRKDGDGTAPSVKILSPSSGQALAIPDTLVVTVQVSDDRLVEGVVVSLVDAQGSPVASQVAIVNAMSATVTRKLVVTSERLVSGTYSVIARASDGTNEGRDFQDVNVMAAPWRLRAVFIAPPPSTDPVNIIRMDSTGILTTWSTMQDFNGMAVDSYTQHVMLAGSRFAPFQAIPTAPSSTGWQVPPPMNDAPEQFTALTVDPFDGRTYFATRDGFIRGFTGDGAQRFTGQCLTGHRCEAIAVLGDRLAAWQRAIVGGAQIVVTYTVAGTAQGSLPVEHERVALFRLTSERLLHFANDAGSGLIEQLNLDAMGTPDLRTLPEEMIAAVARVSDDRYILALPDRLVAYRYSTNTVAQFAQESGIRALEFDPATGAIFAGQGSTLLTLDANTGVVTNSMAIGSEIDKIGVLRNR